MIRRIRRGGQARSEAQTAYSDIGTGRSEAGRTRSANPSIGNPVPVVPRSARPSRPHPTILRRHVLRQALGIAPAPTHTPPPLQRHISAAGIAPLRVDCFLLAAPSCAIRQRRRQTTATSGIYMGTRCGRSSIHQTIYEALWHPPVPGSLNSPRRSSKVKIYISTLLFANDHTFVRRLQLKKNMLHLCQCGQSFSMIAKNLWGIVIFGRPHPASSIYADWVASSGCCCCVGHCAVTDLPSHIQGCGFCGRWGSNWCQEMQCRVMACTAASWQVKAVRILYEEGQWGKKITICNLF